MLMMLCLQLSQLWRLHRMEKKIDENREAWLEILEYWEDR